MAALLRLNTTPASVLLVVTALCLATGPVVAQVWKEHRVPLFVSAFHPSGHQGFVRIINRSDDPGDVLIGAVDDMGVPSALVTLRILAGETVHFNSGDLEDGNAEKGLSRGIGTGDGDWRLRLRSELDLEVLAYNRTSDGLLAPLHDLVPRAVVRQPETDEEAMGHRVAIFNPASNVSQVSRLRIINRGNETAVVTIEGIDDDGETPGTGVELEVPSGASHSVTAKELESGEGEGLAGMLGDGQGKWQLVVTSDEPVEVMSLLSSPTGHLTNLSTEPKAGEGDMAGEHEVPLFAAADNRDEYQGFVRVINHSGEVGDVSVEAFDDDGMAYGPVTLEIDANQTVHFNSGDLEEGNPDKRLMEGIGSEGIGDWRLVLRSDLDIEVLAYNRTEDGLLTTLHDVVPYREVERPGGQVVREHDVAIFNPGSNDKQASRLRIINPSDEAAVVTIEGIDDAGASPGPGVRLTVPKGASRTLTAQALESGQWEADSGASGRLGDGTGKWRLAVTSAQSIGVMSLMASPTNHLVNLSTAGPDGVPVPAPVAAASAAIEITGKSTASTGTPVALSVTSIGTSDVDIERYEWVFSDGQRERGEEVSVSFAEAGVHDVTVSAMRGTDVVAQTTWAVAVFDAAAGANPGFEGIPAVFGDVDRDGSFDRGDLARAEQGVAGERELDAAAVEAGDLDLSGALDERDVELMRQALDDGEVLPSAILDELAYPGGVVAMVSPSLRNPDADVEVFVDGVASPQVMRAILGYATFEVPASLTGADAEVDVTVEADGVVAERLGLHLKPAVTPVVSAKEDVLAFLDELAAVVARQQRAGEDFVDQNGGLSADERAIVLGAGNAAARQIADAAGALEVLLNGESGEELATILQASLYANGLAELRDGTRTAAKGAGAAADAGGEAAGSLANVCDIYAPAVCAIKDARGVLSRWSQVAPGLCTEANLWLARGSLGYAGRVVGYTDSLCAPLMAAMNFAEVLTRFVASMELGMRLRSNRSVIRAGESATITAEVTFGGLHDLCTDATSGVADKVADKVDGTIVARITRLLMKKSKRVEIVQKVLKKLRLPDSLLLAAIDKSVGIAVTRLGLDDVFGKAIDALCGHLRFDGAGAERVAVLPADGGDFNLRASNDGAALTPTNDGTGTYRLACPAGFSGTLEVTGNKDLCGRDRRDEVRVSCMNACPLEKHQEVHLPDAFLRARIELELNKAPGDPITRAEMESLQTLWGQALGIVDLTGLECATGLKTLALGFHATAGRGVPNRIADLTPLSGLTALNYLVLDHNRISDARPLSGLTALIQLTLQHNELDEVTALSDLTALTLLYLNDNRITSVMPLSGMTAMNSLRLHNNRITDVTPLSGMTALSSLYLNDNRIRRVSLSGFAVLLELFLARNEIAHVSLPGLTGLVHLDLQFNRITNVSGLSGLTNLQRLYLTDNRISDIGPLVANPGLNRDDILGLAHNPLSATSCSTHIPTLRRRGVSVDDYGTGCRTQ